jgi:site-specific DNA-methyltransferase (adenine-specific)
MTTFSEPVNTPFTMAEVPLHLIDKGTRYREDYGDIDELAASIQENGLICPIAISNHPEADSAYQYLLCAGGRRFAAHEKLEATHIPANIYNRQLTEIELRTIELEENLKRKDLLWEEKCTMRKKIHDLKLLIHGPKTSTAVDAPGHSIRDTAAQLGVSHMSVSRDLKLAETMQKFPEIAWSKCKNQSDAEKLVKKIEQTFVKEELAKRVEASLGGNANLKIRKLADAYIVRDFFDVAKEIPANMYQFVEIDPPYAIDLVNVKKDYINDGYNEVPAEDYPAFMQKVFAECYRVMAANSWGVCWFGPDPWYSHIITWLRAAGFNVCGIPCVWIKPSGQTKSPNTRLANAYESFFYFAKGQPAIIGAGRINVFNYPPVPHQYKTHPTERPVEMIRDLLKTFTMPGSHVLVPFAGSGATLIAAALENMIPLGTDLTSGYRDGYILNLKRTFDNGLKQQETSAANRAAAVALPIVPG